MRDKLPGLRHHAARQQHACREIDIRFDLHRDPGRHRDALPGYRQRRDALGKDHPCVDVVAQREREGDVSRCGNRPAHEERLGHFLFSLNGGAVAAHPGIERD
ncbi:hypothetical protein [Cupriavidus sp. D39]|uniref:hypothetical protein n=1 Tax=Cupriavidus sp. D39 TaxID=2997877 RepID=UPI0022718038|nr:hypothetical protein [Cupriavidus sp. D39]MCY0852664.1 hypothetical protein [Cupriavidus sp. D39]